MKRKGYSLAQLRGAWAAGKYSTKDNDTTNQRRKYGMLVIYKEYHSGRWLADGYYFNLETAIEMASYTSQHQRTSFVVDSEKGKVLATCFNAKRIEEISLEYLMFVFGRQVAEIPDRMNEPNLGPNMAGPDVD